jgi:hypothetical protein
MSEEFPIGDYERLEADRDRLKQENAALKLQVGELRKVLAVAIQYMDHLSFGHNRNEGTLEIKHDNTCSKCVALKVYFGTEETEKRVEDFRELNDRQAKEGVAKVREDLRRLDEKRVEEPPVICPRCNVELSKTLGWMHPTDCLERNRRLES